MEKPPAPPEAVLIRLAREAAGIRVADAAKRAGVSVARWSQIESGSETRNGNVNPVRAKAGTLARMAREVGVSPERLKTEGERPDAAEILQEMRQHEPGASTGAAPAPLRPVPEFPWTPGPAYLSDEERQDATPLAMDILLRIVRAQDAGRDPAELTGWDLFGTDDPGLGQSWDAVRQRWDWRYAVWMVASGAAKYAADRGRRQAGGRGALIPRLTQAIPVQAGRNSPVTAETPAIAL